MVADSSQDDQHPPTSAFQQKHLHRPSIHPILEEGRRLSRAFSFAQRETNHNGSPQRQQQRPELITSDTNSTLTGSDNLCSQYSDAESFISANTDGSFHRNALSTESYNPSVAPMDSSHADSIPHPKLSKAGPYLTIGALQAYTILTGVRCLADPTWIMMRSSDDESGGRKDVTHMGEIGVKEKILLGCSVAFMALSCAGFALRIMDKLPRHRRIPVIAAALQSIFCTAAMIIFLSANKVPQGGQYSHGFLACAISVAFSTIVALMLTVDWWRGFPSAGLTANLKALIISSFVMTTVIIVGAAIYTALEGWSFDQSVNFCIVSFTTIGYGFLSPTTVAGQIVFFTYGILGISAIAFFIVSLRNAVIEQMEWRLVEKFSRPAHMTRVQTRMSARDLSYPLARFEEEQMVKKVVKRNMIMRMFIIWIVLWFGGAGVFCAIEAWTFLEALYFCVCFFFVTLTTIGFGDFVPKEPGAIEFWNIYVFVGLTVFAYVLSLFSESMASRIHLVDDEDLDDEDEMFGWEQCEDDPNAPWKNWNGMLGLEGQKWAQQKHQLNPEQNGTEMDIMESVPGQEKNESRPLNSVTFQDPDELARRNSLTNDQHWQPQQQQHQEMMRNRAKRRSSAGRALLVPAKERKQMLEAEYYATHGGMMAQSHGEHADMADVNAHYNTMYALRDTSLANGSCSQDHQNENSTIHSRASMISVPTTIRFMDARGMPHYRRRMSLVPENGFGAGGMAGASRLANNAPGEILGHFDPYGDGVTFETQAYYSDMAKRRQQRPSDRTLGRSTSASGIGIDRRSSLQRSGPTVPDQVFNQSPEHMMGSQATTPTRQQVRFESPMGSPKSLVALRMLQDQHERDRQEWRAQNEMKEVVKAAPSSLTSLASRPGIPQSFGCHMDPPGGSSMAPIDSMGSTKLPWPSEGDDNDFWMPSELKCSCESRSSDATNVVAPEMTNVHRTSISSEEPSSLSSAADSSQPMASVPLSLRSFAATIDPAATTDVIWPVGPLGEVRTDDMILKFEKDIDLNQVSDPSLLPFKGHKMPKKKKSPLSSPVQISDRRRSEKSSKQLQKRSDGGPSNSTLPLKLNVRKDIGPVNETRDEETILQFENKVDLNNDIEAPKAEPPSENLHKKSGKRGKDSLKKSAQSTNKPPDLNVTSTSNPANATSFATIQTATLLVTGIEFETTTTTAFATASQAPTMRPSHTHPNEKTDTNNTSSISMATTATGGGARLFSPNSSRPSSIATTISLGPFDEQRESASVSRFDIDVDLSCMGSGHETHRQELERPNLCARRTPHTEVIFTVQGVHSVNSDPESFKQTEPCELEGFRNEMQECRAALDRQEKQFKQAVERQELL
ncbi:Potassium channel, partial [Haplosporangium bisporale]